MNENKGISTLTEVLSRGNIRDIFPSELREGIYILIFADGTQANIDAITLAELDDALNTIKFIDKQLNTTI